MMIRFAIMALLILEGVLAMAIPLEALPKGGWTTIGLPYTALFSPDGYLESLAIEGYEFVAPDGTGPRGLFVANGNTRLPFTRARVEDDAFVLEAGDQARIRLSFLPERIHLTLENASIPDGHFARLEMHAKIARVKNPVTGAEYPLPLKSTIAEAFRVIAPNGASLTLPGAYLIPTGPGVYQAKLPWTGADMLPTDFSIAIAPKALLEDQIRVVAKTATADFTYWTGGPQPFTTEVTNMLKDEIFRGTLVISVKDYLTKRVVGEMKQSFVLGRGDSKALPWKLDSLGPGLYLAEIWVERKDERGLCGTTRVAYHAAAILPPTLPKDFDAFWAGTLQEQAAIPLDLQITKVKDEGKSEVYKFSFAGLLGYRGYGWLVVPQNKSVKVPGVLILPTSGLHTIPQPRYPNGDVAAMAISINTMDVDLPAEAYDWRTWPAPYLVTGILDKRHYSLRFSYAALARAAEILAARPEVDAKKLLVMGSSQGGGLTLVAAGLYPHFTAAIANVPGLCRLDWNFDYLNPPYFPIAASEEGKPMIRRTLPYFDAAAFAGRVKCPVWMSVGLYDDVTPSLNVFSAYNAIPGPKKLLVQPQTGHGGGWGLDAVKGLWP